MTKLYEIASALKSQNAGATHYAFAVMFDDPENYRRVLASTALHPERIAGAYRIAADDVQVRMFPPAHSVVVSFPRPTLNGNPDDTDIDGAQQHVPLMLLEIDDEEHRT